MYEELHTLAQEKSPERRVQLLRKVSELYFESTGSNSDAEKYIFSEIIDQIVSSITKEHKLDLVPDCDMNAQLARRLAGDSDIEVAAPVIRRSEALTDDDLIAIATSASRAHQYAIASRTSVSEAVTDVLIDHGDQKVVHTLSANEGAQFSSAGMERLVDQAAKDVDLCELLVERPDLSQEATDKLLPLVCAGLATRLAEHGLVIEDGDSAGAMRDLRRHFSEAMRHRRENIQNTQALIVLVRNGTLPLDDAVAGLVGEQRLLDIFTLVCTIANVDRKYLFGLVSLNQMVPLLVVFRSLDLRWPTVEGILRLAANQRRSDRDISQARAAYRAVDSTIAQRMLRFVRVRRAAIAVH